jgi:hypothetical protein
MGQEENIISPGKRYSSGALLLVPSVIAPTFLSLSCLLDPCVWLLVRKLFGRLCWRRRTTDIEYSNRWLLQIVPRPPVQVQTDNTLLRSGGLMSRLLSSRAGQNHSSLGEDCQEGVAHSAHYVVLPSSRLHAARLHRRAS